MNCFLHCSIQRYSRDMKNRTSKKIFGEHQRDYINSYSALHYDCACSCSNTFHNFITAGPVRTICVSATLAQYVCLYFFRLFAIFSHTFFSASWWIKWSRWHRKCPRNNKMWIRWMKRVRSWRTAKTTYWNKMSKWTISHNKSPLQFRIIQTYFNLTLFHSQLKSYTAISE